MPLPFPQYEQGLFVLLSHALVHMMARVEHAVVRPGLASVETLTQHTTTPEREHHRRIGKDHRFGSKLIPDRNGIGLGEDFGQLLDERHLAPCFAAVDAGRVRHPSGGMLVAVSYTHLTLPTILLV